MRKWIVCLCQVAFLVDPLVTVGSADSPVVINELMYNPSSDRPEDEYVEIYNPSQGDIDISGWHFSDGIEYVFPPGIVIEAGGFLIVSKSPADAAVRYGVANAYGPFEGRLNDGGETLTLADANGAVVESFTYRDEHGWPQTADGEGPSLERRHPRMNPLHPQSWSAGPTGGTPGRRNRSFIAVPEPVIWNVDHRPLVPSPGQEVIVSCRVDTVDPLAAVTLFHRKDGDPSFVETAMSFGEGGLYRATIGPADQGVIQEFAIKAVTTTGAEGRYPALAPEQTVVYQVDGSDYPSDLPLYRIVMRSALERQLFSRDLYSDVQLDACFYAHNRAFHNVGVRFRGKGSRHYPTKSYRVDFTRTEPFGTIRKLNLNAQRPEVQLIGLEFFRRARMPGPTYKLVSVIFNNKYVREYIQVERCDKDMIRRVFGQAGGNLYRGVEHADLDYRGKDKRRYRTHYVKETNEREDDYSDIVQLSYVFSNTSDEEFPEAIRREINVEEWLRWFAIKVVLNDEEGGISNDNRGDDYYLYHRPEDDLFYILPWDMDSVLMNSNQTLFPQKLPAIRRLLTHPAFVPTYYSQIASLKANEFAESRMAEIIDLTEPILSRAGREAIKRVVRERHADIEALMPMNLSVNIERSGGERTIFQPGDVWRFFRGRSEPSPSAGRPTLRWTLSDFDDSRWERGATGIGYGDGDDATVLADMRGNYTSVYMRYPFEISDPRAVTSLTFSMDYDDSFVAYLNGHEVARRNVSGEPPGYRRVADGNHEAGSPEVFDLRHALPYLVAGTNLFAIQGHNVSLRNSSDFSLIPTLKIGLAGNNPKLYGAAPVTKTSTVWVNGEKADYVITEGRWSVTLEGRAGLNEFVVEVRGPDGNTLEGTSARLYIPGVGVSVSGELEGDTHWTAEGGPYYVAGDLVVPPGTILTIEAGTTVVLAKGTGIAVYGQMFVAGTAANPVRFLVEGWRDRWKGIAFDRPSGESGLRGCDFSYGTQAESGGTVFPGVVSARNTTLTVEECTFTHLANKGIDMVGGNLIARGCVFEDIGEGIHCDQSSAVIESCTFSGVRGHEDAIDLDNSLGQPSIIRKVAFFGGEDDGIDIGNGSVLIESCWISGASDKGISVEGTGLKTIVNSVITDNDIGIEAKHKGEIRVVNCTIAGNKSMGIHLFERDAGLGGGKATVLNTILWNNQLEIGADTRSLAIVSYSDVRGGFPGENNIDADPLFVDVVGGDFRLASLSPCADSGSSMDAPDVDFRGAPRPEGNGFDMGAYEHEGETGIADWPLIGP